ncbi:MAG TPA: ribosome assembly cofactor RimP [Prolixibacteraceae bacterium]|nr:ribosome assembly cofactor RimP [Prolixibacteraceae bacterium]
MIDKAKVAEITTEKLAEDQFLVDVTVSPNNEIHVMVDSDSGISINQIVEISRYVESKLDRESEDFELSVYSAGLTEPFRLVRQYKKNQGKEIEVLLAGGQKLNGVLVGVSDQEIELEVTTKEKPEGSKKKELVTRIHHLGYSEIKEAKKILKF